jgi:hypothetical protein
MSGLLIYKGNVPMTKLEYCIIIAIITILGLFAIYNINGSSKCEERGGTWFIQQGKCLSIKEMK